MAVTSRIQHSRGGLSGKLNIKGGIIDCIAMHYLNQTGWDAAGED